MRNVRTRNKIIEKLWARYVSQYHWNVENFRTLWKKRHTEEECKYTGTLNLGIMLNTQLNELRVLKIQMIVSNINWDVINRECPIKYAKRLLK